MIQSIDQCHTIQRNRVKKGQYGVAKAVLRFIAKQTSNSGDFDRIIRDLPVSRTRTKKETTIQPEISTNNIDYETDE